MCLANPDIANNLVRYPIISSEYRYGVQKMLLVHNEYMSFLIPREIYHGLQWKTDKLFFAPMATFTYHIQQFLCHVSYTLSSIYSTIMCLFTGWL